MPALSAIAVFFQDDLSLARDLHQIMIAEWIIAICILLIILALVGAVIFVLILVRKVETKIEQATKTVQARAIPLVAQGQDILGKVQGIIADVKPKVASVTSDVQHISGVVKTKVDEIGGTVSKVVGEVSETVTKVTGQVGDTVTKVKDQVDDTVTKVKGQVDDTVTKVKGQVDDTVTKVSSTVQDVNGKTQAQVERVNGIVTEALTTTEQVSRSVQHGIQVPVEKIVVWVASAKTGLDNLNMRLPFLSKLLGQKAPAKSTKTTQSTAGGQPVVVPSASRSEK